MGTQKNLIKKSTVAAKVPTVTDLDIIATDLAQRVAVSASDIDWSCGGIYTKNISGATTFTFSIIHHIFGETLNKTLYRCR